MTYTVVLNSNDKAQQSINSNDAIYNFNWCALEEGEYKVTWTYSKVIYNKGLQFTLYNGYYNGNLTFFDTAIIRLGLQGVSSGYSSDLTDIGTSTNQNEITNGGRTGFSIQFLGFFFTGSNPTGTWTFYLQTDNESMLWLGPVATTGYTYQNCVVTNPDLNYDRMSSGTIELITNTYYPIRIMFGDGGGGYSMATRFKSPNGNIISDGAGYYFH